MTRFPKASVICSTSAPPLVSRLRSLLLLRQTKAALISGWTCPAWMTWAPGRRQRKHRLSLNPRKRRAPNPPRRMPGSTSAPCSERKPQPRPLKTWLLPRPRPRKPEPLASLRRASSPLTSSAFRKANPLLCSPTFPRWKCCRKTSGNPRCLPRRKSPRRPLRRKRWPASSCPTSKT